MSYTLAKEFVSAYDERIKYLGSYELTFFHWLFREASF